MSVQLPADSLTLEGALVLARANRGDVTVAAARAVAARADRRVAGALPNPVASYEYTGDTPRQHATLEQPLDWLLRRSGARAAGRAGVTAAVADSVGVAAQVEREVRHAFFGMIGATRRLALATDEAALADSLAAIAGRRRAAGETSALEDAQAALEAARTRQNVSVAREAHAAAAAELARALGLEDDAVPPLTGALDAAVTESLPPAPALDALPAVVRVRADSVAARAQYRVAQWSRLPLPSVRAGIEWDDPANPDGGATVLFGVSLPLPLWQWGGAPAAASAARADEAAGRVREVRTEAARLLALTAARVRESARRAVVARDSILPLAARQRMLALLAYRAGETAIVPVLDALRAERRVARELVADLLAYQEARADWLALVGGGE